MHKYTVSFIIVAFCWATIKAQTQEYLYILNEGTMDYQGSIGRIHLSNLQYEHLDSIASFGNDLKIYDNQLYVTDGFGNIKIYQLNPFQLQKTISLGSARQVVKYQNQLVFTCMASPHLRVYDLVGDSILYNVDTNYIASIPEGLWVENDKAYVLVNGFGSDSALFIWNLATKSWVKTIQTASNPNEFIKIDNALYFNCLDYINGVTFQKLDLATDSITLTKTTSLVSYGGLTAKSNHEILFNFNANFPSNVSLWNIQTDVIDTNYFVYADAYALNYHIPSNRLFYSVTDYVSFGKVIIKSISTSDTVNVHISPRRLVYHQETTTSLHSNKALTESKIYPNPATKWVQLDLPNGYEKLEIYQLDGKKIYETNERIQSIDVTGWKRGIYMIVIKVQNQIETHKLLVE